MKQWTLVLVTVLCTLYAPPCGRAQDTAHRFIAAMDAYKAEDYGTAIQEMDRIVQSGVRNGALFYNLGNANLKDNRLGHAILWYERALKLLPNDPDLRFNADYARSLTRDAIDEDAVSALRIIFFWKYRLSHRTVIVLAATLNLLLWSVLIARRLTGRRGLRYAAMAIALPTIIFISTAAFNYYEAAHLRQGIVIQDRVSVRSGLERTSTELFALHAGAKIKIVHKNARHLKIRFGKDKIGWVDAAAIGLI